MRLRKAYNIQSCFRWSH